MPSKCEFVAETKRLKLVFQVSRLIIFLKDQIVHDLSVLIFNKTRIDNSYFNAGISNLTN